MQKSLKFGPHLAPKVKSLLASKATLPATGIIAGQAVCSAILELLGKGSPVYNDIDIFNLASPEQSAFLQSEEHLRAEALRLACPLAASGYTNMRLNEGSLHLLGATQEGLVNYIWCKSGHDALSATEVVFSFDLNAVEVALDLATTQLAWSKEFEFFLQHNELQLTSVGTPARTLLRYLKKKEELKSWGNDALVFNLLASRMREVPANASLRGKFVNLAQRFEPCYRDVFELSAGRDLTVRSSWQEPAELSDRGEALRKIGDESGALRLSPMLAYQSLRKTSAKLAQKDECIKSKEVVGPEILFARELTGADYLSGSVSATHVEVVDALFRKHPGLLTSFFGLTMAEQYECARYLVGEAKRKGPHIIGWVETRAIPLDMREDHHRKMFFDNMELRDSAHPLCEALFESLEQNGWSCKELRFGSELRDEGFRLQHCVGGYSSRVSSGIARVLAIRGPQYLDSSTVELAIKTEPGCKPRLRVTQHYSFKNTPPSQGAQDFLRTYLESECQRLGLEWKTTREKAEEFMLELG